MARSIFIIGMVAIAFMSSLYVAETANKVAAAQAKKAAIGGSFTLTNQEGKPVRDTELHGKPMLVFFGFTQCGDICPTTALIMSQVAELLSKDHIAITPVFITIDPKNDTASVLKAYLANLHSSFIGLTGTQEEIAAVVKSYKAFAEKAEDSKDPKTAYNHSSNMYLMDAKGYFVALFSAEDGTAKIVEKIKEMQSVK